MTIINCKMYVGCIYNMGYICTREEVEIEINEGSTESQTQKVVEAVKKELKSYWRCFQS